MNVNQINRLLATGEIEREDIWPRIREYNSKAIPYLYEFGLDQLPTQPGLIIVRGPRQYGKSTWLDLELRETIRRFGKATAFYLNGDELQSKERLYQEIIALSSSFRADAPQRRIFIDEISAIPEWEWAIKRGFDEGATRNVLIVTTGSRATDLLRGAERLPGRKGSIARTNYFFGPISYKQFHKHAAKRLGASCLTAYLLSGGAPLACNELHQHGQIPEYFIELIRDWILGEIVRTGRSRQMLHQVLEVLFARGGAAIGYAKIAREAGLANNTVASGYIDQLSDLLCLTPQWHRDPDRKVYLFRKPAKIPFINLAAVIAFHPATLRGIEEFNRLPEEQRAMFVEWLVAQELYRRATLTAAPQPQLLGFWASKEHEIDFVTQADELFEVKLGRAGPLDFTWFPRVFPKRRLTVICASPFETDSVRGITLEQFLMEGPSRI